MNEVIYECVECQLVKDKCVMCFGMEELQSIPICDLLFLSRCFRHDGPLFKTPRVKKFILFWQQITIIISGQKGKLLALTNTKFLYNEVIYKFGLPKFVPNNGIGWVGEFIQLCQAHGIKHQHTFPTYPQCNGMMERLVKIMKHGPMFMVTFVDNHVNDQDL